LVVALALLVLNDWLFKAARADVVTGKLSDFAGLFAFPLVWTALMPRRRDAVFLLTAVGFVLWKSPATDVPLAMWNALSVFPLTRVVDYTDWVALTALVPSYRLACRHADGAGTAISRPSLVRRVRALGMAACAIAAFAATSIAPPRHYLDDPTSYAISASGTEVRAGLQQLDLHATYREFNGMGTRRGSSADTLHLGVDTMLIYMRQPPERVLGVTIEVRELGPSEVSIRLLTASAFGPEPRLESVRRAFGVQVIDPLRELLARQRTAR
jgi:hypothetical protein